MRIASGSTDRYLYFVAVDATDLKTRETGLSSFAVYRSRNGASAAAMSTPTVNETDSTNMPGVYELLLDEDTTLAAGNDSEEMALHITATGMAPVTRVVEIYRPEVTLGSTLAVADVASILIDTAEIGTAGAGLSAVPWNSSWDAEVQSECTDALNAYDPPTKAEVDSAHATTDALITTVDSVVDSILVDTAEIGTAGAGLTAVPWNISWDSEVQSEVTDALNAYDPPTKAELDSGLAVLSTVTTAQVNAQMVDVLSVDTLTLPGQSAPPAAPTIAAAVGWLYKISRNKKTQTASQWSLYDDAGITVDAKATVSDDGTTSTKQEIATGP